MAAVTSRGRAGVHVPHHAARPKSTERRTTPHLVPYEELADEIREYDRPAVRLIPSLLAGAAYTIARTPTSRPEQSGQARPSSSRSHAEGDARLP